MKVWGIFLDLRTPAMPYGVWPNAQYQVGLVKDAGSNQIIGNETPIHVTGGFNGLVLYPQGNIWTNLFPFAINDAPGVTLMLGLTVFFLNGAWTLTLSLASSRSGLWFNQFGRFPASAGGFGGTAPVYLSGYTRVIPAGLAYQYIGPVMPNDGLPMAVRPGFGFARFNPTNIMWPVITPHVIWYGDVQKNGNVYDINPQGDPSALAIGVATLAAFNGARLMFTYCYGVLQED